MEFKRARSASQKAERKNEIKTRALEIFVERGFKEITFVNIAEDLSIKRPLIYTYYANVADIMLDAIGDRVDEMIGLLKDPTSEEDVFSNVLDYILGDEAFLKIIAIYKVAIEPSSTLECLVEHEFKITKFHKEYEDILATYHPELSRQEIRDKFTLFWSLLIGMANLNNATAKQDEALREIGFNTTKIDIKEQIMRVMYKMAE